jgi:hypothetical protein
MKKNSVFEKLTAEQIKLKQKELVGVYAKKNSETRFKSPAQKFMNDIRETLQDMLNDEVNYTNMSNSIYDVFSIKISPPTIRNYCQQNLSVPLSEKKKRPNLDAVSDSQNSSYDKDLRHTDDSDNSDDNKYLAM